MKPLVPFHKNSPFQVFADVEWKHGRYRMRFRIEGPIGEVSLLNADAGVISQQPLLELWKHTCFESFLGPVDQDYYYEINLSSAGDWTVFRFTGERKGRVTLEKLAPLSLKARRGDSFYEFEAEFDFSSLEDLRGARLRTSPAVILEAGSGGHSYWAAAHSGERPDFHKPAHRVWILA